MNIDDRIERRLGYETGASVLADPEALSPVVHTDSPVGRGPVIEQLLDTFEAAFSGSLPPSVYVYGPKGSGKSAIVSGLFERLARHGGPRRAILTSTRAVQPTIPSFVYVDTRTASTRFRLYRTVLAAVSDEPVPDHGIGTDELAETLRDAVRSGPDLVVAIDHTNEPETPTATTVVEWLGDVGRNIVPTCIGRDHPDAVDWESEQTVEFGKYRRHVLVELLTSRCSAGVGRDALSHGQIREIADWAAGDAHDALAVVMGAAVNAERASASTIRSRDISAGIEGVPRPCASLGRVLALPESRQRLLYELTNLSEENRSTVNSATENIAARPDVDLSASTVRRILYELADDDLLERMTVQRSDGKGRPPSRIVPRFPTTVFQELFDRNTES
ncbi:MAG: Cdc6/Cdc18 family protein [Haloferacaceae archaeon]